jgi:hypothetical protein
MFSLAPCPPCEHRLHFESLIAKFEVLTAAIVNAIVSWDIPPYSLVHICRRFTKHFASITLTCTLILAAAASSETSVHTYQTTWSHVTEDSKILLLLLLFVSYRYYANVVSNDKKDLSITIFKGCTVKWPWHILKN